MLADILVWHPSPFFARFVPDLASGTPVVEKFLQPFHVATVTEAAAKGTEGAEQRDEQAMKGEYVAPPLRVVEGSVVRQGDVTTVWQKQSVWNNPSDPRQMPNHPSSLATPSLLCLSPAPSHPPSKHQRAFLWVPMELMEQQEKRGPEQSSQENEEGQQVSSCEGCRRSVVS